MIIYVTNKWAHYQGSICRELAKIFGNENFKMLLTDPLNDGDEINDTHKKMNWTHRPDPQPWLIQPPETPEDFEKGVWANLLATADVAIVGAMYGCKTSTAAVRERVSKGLLTFFSNERFFKDPVTLKRCLSLRFWRMWLSNHRLFSYKNVHYLPIDHYGAEDMRFFSAANGRVWRWAYFPEVSSSPMVKNLREKMRVCWCGRMIPCKRVDYIIKALVKIPVEFRERMEVTIVGEGETKEQMIAMVRENNLSHQISFRPFLSPSGVVDFLAGQDVYILASDRHEGWGVALQEAMDKCCVPIANTSAGVTLAVVEDKVDGFTFEDGDINTIADRLVWLCNHPERRREMGLKAWEKMQGWSPAEGARRFAILLDAIKTDNYSKIPKSGLCSNLG